MSQNQRKTILVVEDQKIVSADLESTLEGLGYQVIGTAVSGEEAIAKSSDFHPDLVLMDIHLQGEMDGIQAAAVIRERLDVPVVYLTAYADEETVLRAKVTAPFGYIVKPFNERELRGAIEIALYQHDTERLLRMREQWLSTTLRSIGDSVIAMDPTDQVNFINSAAVGMTGWSDEEVRGRQISDVCCIVSATGQFLTAELLAKVVHSPSTIVPEDSYLMTRHGRCVPVDGSVAVISDGKGTVHGKVVVLRDATARKRSEKARLQLADEEARRRAAEEDERRALFLAKLSAAFAASLDHDVIVQQIVKLPLVILADACFLVEVDGQGSMTQVAEAAQAGESLAVLQSLRATPVPKVVGDMAQEVLRSGWVRHFRNYAAWVADSVAPTDSYAEVMTELGPGSVIVTPVVTRSGATSVLFLVRTGVLAREHTGSELTLAAEVGQRAGVALDHARLYRQEQEALQAFRLLVEGVQDYAIVMLDTRGHVVSWNTGAERINGYRTEDIMGKHFSIFYPREDLQSGKPVAALEGAIREGRVEDEGWRVRKNGSCFWANVVITAMRDQAGNLRGFSKVARDLSDRKRMEDVQRLLDSATVALTSSLEISDTLQKAARLVIPMLADWCLIDLASTEGHLVQVAAAHIEPDKEELARQLVRDFPPQLRLEHGAYHVFRTGKAEVHPVISDPQRAAELLGIEFPELLRELGVLSYLCVPMQFRGHTLGVINLLSARPTMRYASWELAVAEEFARRAGLAIDNARLFHEAQDAVRARDEFLSVASHELRTPLSSLVLQLAGVQSLLPEITAADSSKRRLSDKIERSVRATGRLAKLIDSLLDVSRITTGRMALQLEEGDLAAIVRDAVLRMSEEARRAGCELRVDADEPVMGRWDLLRIEQVVANLLSNAIKYGPGKPIEVRVSAMDERATLSVRDHGIGIAQADIERIFGRFDRAVPVKHYGGLGLGLYITRQIVEAHDGTIQVTSEPGAGALFTIELPRRPPAGQDFEPQPGSTSYECK